MTSEVKRGLPTWAKVLIGIVVVGIVVGVISIIGLIIFFQNVMKEAQDPAAIAKTAKSIAVFKPLPEGYEYAFALSLGGVNTLTVKHKPSEQMIILISYPTKEKTDPQVLVEKVFESGIKAPGQQNLEGSKFEEVKEKGTATIGGEQMPYMVGTMTDKSGTKVEGMVGAAISPKEEKTLFVYGMQPSGDYNIDATMKFLDTIQSF